MVQKDPMIPDDWIKDSFARLSEAVVGENKRVLLYSPLHTSIDSQYHSRQHKGCWNVGIVHTRDVGILESLAQGMLEYWNREGRMLESPSRGGWNVRLSHARDVRLVHREMWLGGNVRSTHLSSIRNISRETWQKTGFVHTAQGKNVRFPGLIFFSEKEVKVVS